MRKTMTLKTSLLGLMLFCLALGFIVLPTVVSNAQQLNLKEIEEQTRWEGTIASVGMTWRSNTGLEVYRH